MEVIVGLKQTPGIQKQFLDKIDREAIYSGKNQVILKETIVYAQHFAYLQCDCLVQSKAGSVEKRQNDC